MKSWQVGSTLGLGLIALASGCAGGGASSAGGLSANISTPLVLCELGSAECGIPPPFTEADRLVLSPTSPDDPTALEFIAAARIEEPVETPPSIAAVIDMATFTAAYANAVTIQNEPGDVFLHSAFSLGVSRLDLNNGADDLHIRMNSQAMFYCPSQITCYTDDFVNLPWGYDAYVRTPGVLTLSVGIVTVTADGQQVERRVDRYLDEDGYMTRFTALKTAKNSELIVFGTAVSMRKVTIVGQSTLFDADPDDADGPSVVYFTDASYARYATEESWAFVDGQRFSGAALPVTGYAAYLGFANAYAESSNREFLPFTHAGRSDAAYFGTGHSAMVFSFNGGEANFEHGFIDLFGNASRDDGRNGDVPIPVKHVMRDVNGVDVLDSDGNFVYTHGLVDANDFAVPLAGRFSSPSYLDESFAPAQAPKIARSYAKVSGYVEKPDGEVELGIARLGSFARNSAWFTRSSSLLFRLAGNSETDNQMDFNMELVNLNLDNPEDARCYIPDVNVVCYSSRSASNGAGLLDWYGSAAALTTNTDASGAPTFVGGVWQYNKILYVDTKGTATESDDELLGIVDLLGTVGGLVYDADPGPLPSASP